MRLLYLLCWIPFHFSAHAQEDEKIKDAIEAFAEDNPEETDLSSLTDRLTNFQRHPINLNKTTPEQLKELFFLSPLQINNFFIYTAKNRLLDVLELQAIPGFDIATVNKVLPFVTLTNLSYTGTLKPKDLLFKSNHDLMLRYSSVLQQQKGFKDLTGSRYLGTPEKLLVRYRYNFMEILSATINMEKDPGESIISHKHGVDYLSANIALFKLGMIRKLVIGDYTLQFGQGLTLWSGFSFGKGPDVTSVAAKDIGLKPYTSTNEAAFFRGIASTIFMGGNINFTPFISVRKLDASLKALPDGSFTVSNINISGLHRTQTELKNQKSLKQQVYGAAVQYLTGNLNIGIIGYQSQYQHRFTTGNQSYNRYSFTGKKLENAGFHYNYTFRNIYLYGEIGHSSGAGHAIIHGAMASLSPKTSVVLLYRNYEKDYHNFFSKAVGEGTETSNEQGWYTGFNHKLPGNLTWSFYGDYFKFPWLKYRVGAPSSGFEALSQLDYVKRKVFKVTLRFKVERKQQNPDAGSSQESLEPLIKENYRLDWSWKISRKFNFHQRTEIANYQKGIKRKETGFLIFQDVDYTPLSARISANCRLAFFNTPSYNSRIYAYEDDVLYAGGSGVYAGKGFRSYVNSRYKLSRKADLWTKFALSVYSGVKTIGSGLDEIEGNKKSEFTLQLRYQL